MDYLEEDLPLELPLVNSSIIKVIGVGGGGGNAVNHMYRQGITDVSFVVCNTDEQALKKSPVPMKVLLGDGLGAGGNPERGREAAEQSVDKIQELLKDNTKMAFITAGMGGGTGTGASPVVAKALHDVGILTIGIVTIPFAFERRPKIMLALEGVVALSEYVDAILVINNEKLHEIYPDLNLSNAFAKADDVLTNAAKGIAEIITVPGYINTDFADVYNIMKDGKVAIMNTGFASGEHRITRAIEDALNSPLLNTNDVRGAGKMLLQLYCSTQNEIKMEEIRELNDFMDKVGEDVDVIWGASFDDTLGDNVKITMVATGFDVSDIPGMPDKLKDKRKEPQIPKVPFEVNNRPVVTEEEIREEKEREKQETLKKAMREYYEDKVEVEKPEEPVFDMPEFTLDELEDDSRRNDIENIPTWKRMMKKEP